MEFARWLVDSGHQSIVISSGGRLVDTLLVQGSEHIQFPVHKKSLFSLRHIRPLRKLLLSLNADVIHLRSRLPAWLVWLAIGKVPKVNRPAIVTTFHGLYSINRYSEIMGCGDQVIAISQAVYDYIVKHYPRIDAKKITVIHRGVDHTVFNQNDSIDGPWERQFFGEYPQCQNKPLILMPGRLTSWKGQRDFIDIMGLLRERHINCHGLIIGDAEPSKKNYFSELQQQIKQQGLSDTITFLGHRADVEKLFALANVVCNFSTRPEPFGRTVIEALALGTPVVAYNQGGPAESLTACFPEGLVIPGDIADAANKITACIQQKPVIVFPEEFTLQRQAQKTLMVYQQAIEA